MVTASRRRMRAEGSPAWSGFQCAAGRIGSAARLTRMSATCRMARPFGRRNRVERCAYKYPPNKAAWKNSRQVFHTAADPPNHGRIILPIMGWTANSKKALRNTVAAYARITEEAIIAQARRARIERRREVCNRKPIL